MKEQEVSRRIQDAWDARDGHLVGDDLTEEELNSLYDYLFCGKDDGSFIVGWWKDKKHQIIYRLLLRLTRLENSQPCKKDMEKPTLEDVPLMKMVVKKDSGEVREE